MTQAMVAAPLRLALVAPNGRMGRAIAAAASQDKSVEIVDDGQPGQVLIDFSVPAALLTSIARAVLSRIPLLIGTTGLDASVDAQIAEAARKIAILRAANTSLGVALMSDLVERAARVLGEDWDIEIVEMHHRLKADAPSGTALALGQSAARGRGIELAMHSERGRDGIGPVREAGRIGFASLRGGTVAGDHDVIFAGAEERLIISHRAESRAIFARGAITAARFLRDKPPGLYSMKDVIEAA
ncbi:MAG: 4-hydroxy-tetrahydrodipicolinate reductase [Sphingomicrobium sp.]